MASLLAIAHRRQPIGRLERAVKGLQIGIARALRDRFDRKIGLGEIGRCPLQPQPLHRSCQRLAVNGPVDPVPMVRRQTGNLG